MSFEAVPCRFRSSQGPNGETEYIGLLIRPAGENGNSIPPPPVAPPPTARPGSAGASGPVRVLTTGSSITVSGDTAPRYLVPANVSVTPLPIGTTWSTPVPRVPSTPSSNFVTPPPNMSSPCSQQPRSLSVCSSSPLAASSPMSPPVVVQQSMPRLRDQAGSRAGTWQSSNDSSTTPDSGIQSVPGSPPSHHRDSPPTIEACMSVCEDRPEEEDYADMPRLIPIDQEEDETDYCLPGPSGLREEHSTNGSECETTAPVTVSITLDTMDNAKISEQLIQLDPAKAYEIATEIQKRMGISVTTPITAGRKRPVKRTSTERTKKKRPSSSASDEVKKSEEEPTTKVDETVFTPSDSRKMYREAMRRMLERQLNNLYEKMTDGVKELHIGERERHGRKSIKGRNKIFTVDWEALKKRKKREDDKIFLWKDKTLSQYKVEIKKVEENKMKKAERKRKAMETPLKQEPEEQRVSRTSTRTPQKRRQGDSSSSFDPIERKIDLDYEEIPKSVCKENLPGWRVPIIRCACTRGSCSSDAECINRALFVQCPSNCQTSMCINKKFWKDDAVRLLSASGPKSKKSLKTKVAKRAGEFLGEYAGEVISFVEAEKRYKNYVEKEEIPRLLCLSPSLFIDATKKGNICRYVKHSCRPNSRLEVWSINGNLRAGLFPLVDLASNTEVTISMNGLLPVNRACVSCQETDPKCCKIVKRSRNAVLSNTEELSVVEMEQARNSRRFLLRNRQKTIQKARRSFVPKSSSSINVNPLQKIFDSLILRIRRVDGSLPYRAVAVVTNLQKAVRLNDHVIFQQAVESLLNRLNDDDLDSVFQALSNHYLSNDTKEKKKDVRYNRDMDLNYLNIPNPVGSYNPDEAWPKGTANKRADAVRCECGSLEEDGKMLQCDACNFWLHTDCVGNIDESTKFYQCRLCSGEIEGGIPSTDVQLVRQPELRLEGCVYYKALKNNRGIQVRQFETIYLEKTETDEHKKILKKLSEINEKKRRNEDKVIKTPNPLPPTRELKAPGPRKDLRIFRVERLFVSPGGHRFVFGFYYARPHETICDPGRHFHRNEVFATPFYDTLPLDSVVGRCTVLDVDIWEKGRPTVPYFKEEDVLVCEYQIDKSQRSFEKIPSRNRFYINTQPYVFQKFETTKKFERDFTPFLAAERSNSRSSGRLSRSDGTRSSLQSRQQSIQQLESLVSRLSSSRVPSKY